MKLWVLFTLAVFVPGLSSSAQEDRQLLLMTATGHPMQYYVSLPDGWTHEKEWPIVAVVEAAEKQFKQNAERFVDARKDMPFIIVAPIVVTNGNQGRKDPSIYPYTEATWVMIDREGNCAFDIDGLRHVIGDIQKLYNGEEKYYLTGFEAGAHLVWAMTFQHPEDLFASAPVAGNYIGRCMTGELFSSHPSLSDLPVMTLCGETDSSCLPGGPLHEQGKEARNLAVQHGYRNISDVSVPGKGHVPLPEEVLTPFFSLWKSRQQ